MSEIFRRWIAPLAFLSIFAWAGPAAAETARYRLTWNDNPTTTMTVGWDQVGGEEPRLYYGPEDHGTDVDAYPLSAAPSREVRLSTMDNRFVRLADLSPDTSYYFVIQDSDSTSERYWFRTAPATAQPFSLIIGGDTRNNRKPRVNGNQMVAKLRPLAVLLAGDFTNSDANHEWIAWFDDWQHSISPDGRMVPLLPARGNHDSNKTIHGLWDTPSESNVYSVGLAGGLARLYTLNTEVPAGGVQGAWLEQELETNGCARFPIAQYHRPMRPHHRGKSNGNDAYDNWSSLFYEGGLRLAVEADAHTVKRTWPVRPDRAGDEGFSRDDENGTVYIGEGCWGAPLHSNDDPKEWTRASGSFNQVNWVQVHLDRIEIRTLQIDRVDGSGSVDDAHPLEVPPGLPVWNPDSGGVVTIPARPRMDDAGNECRLIPSPDPRTTSQFSDRDAPPEGAGGAGGDVGLNPLEALSIKYHSVSALEHQFPEPGGGLFGCSWTETPSSFNVFWMLTGTAVTGGLWMRRRRNRAACFSLPRRRRHGPPDAGLG